MSEKQGLHRPPVSLVPLPHTDFCTGIAIASPISTSFRCLLANVSSYPGSPPYPSLLLRPCLLPLPMPHASCSLSPHSSLWPSSCAPCPASPVSPSLLLHGSQVAAHPALMLCGSCLASPLLLPWFISSGTQLGNRHQKVVCSLPWWGSLF